MENSITEGTRPRTLHLSARALHCRRRCLQQAIVARQLDLRLRDFVISARHIPRTTVVCKGIDSVMSTHDA